MIERVLVATDGSEPASKAVAFAADLAGSYGAELLVLHVLLREQVPEDMLRWAKAEHLVEEPEGAGAPIDTGYGRFGGMLARGPGVPSGRVLTAVGEAVLAHAERLARSHGGEQVETLMEPGEAARTIVHVAEQRRADVVVVGRRGLGAIKELMVGSVSHKLGHMAPCTVITVK